MRDPRFVVVSGLPASGKSTLARALGLRLDVDVLDKDDYLEELLNPYDDFDAARRTRFSRAADDTLRSRAARVDKAILVSFWRRIELSESAGTPTEWLFDLPNLVEVYCSCEPAVAVERFMHRERHHGHGDQLRTRNELQTQFDALARLGPLGVGPVVIVDTTGRTSPDAVIERLLRARWSSGARGLDM
ncbi:MAG TPA: AAA family ATPase [Acidimicrobiia bacterium]|nr:AAA family ATPase [Acidimicrobiia bacterium]